MDLSRSSETYTTYTLGGEFWIPSDPRQKLFLLHIYQCVQNSSLLNWLMKNLCTEIQISVHWLTTYSGQDAHMIYSVLKHLEKAAFLPLPSG